MIRDLNNQTTKQCTKTESAHMPDSHNFGYYHWVRGYINHARAEIARVEIRYSLFEKKEDFSSASK